MCESWNQDDELQLAAMLHRKNEVMAKRRTVLFEVLNQWKPEDFRFTPDGLTDQMIKHADAITNALKPFTRREVGHAVKFDLPKLEVSSDQN